MAKPIDHRATSGEAICPYCGVGCRLWADIAYDRVLRVKGVPDAPANLGRICAKGATLDQTVASADRAVQPLVRIGSSGELRPAPWPVALDELARRFQRIVARHGPDAVAFYGSGQLDSQAVYCAVKLFKGALGTNNTDSNSRLCMASAVAAYRASLGSDGPPTCYDDIDSAETIVVIGSNMAEAHPVTFDRIRAARKAKAALRLIVVDPRRSLTADHADLHVPVRPGGDIALLNLVARRLLDRGAADLAFVDAHTAGFADYVASLEALDEAQQLAACGVSAETIDALAAAIEGRRFLSFYCMGIGQSTVGMWKINSLINLHLLTGTIGKPGCGPFSLTGQPNAMAGREIGILAHQLPGYRLVEDPQHREEVERYWNLPPGSIAQRPGLSAVEMFRALERGKLKAIWIAATNPLVSLPDLHQVRRALSRAELVVVQDAFHPTEIGQSAHFILPVAAWGEREWTSTNSERMVSYSEKLVEPPGAALPDWEIFCRFARQLGLPGFDFDSASDVWNEWIGLTQGRLCDMTGMPHERLVAERHLQWPCPDPAHPGTQRLYTDGAFAHPDRRARFFFRQHRPPVEVVDHEFPLVLTTGRVYAHWHTMSRTSKVRQLMQRSPEPFVQLHPQTADDLSIAEGDLVQISSRRGSVRLKAQITDRVPPELVFIPIHWGDLQVPGDAVNYLTISATGRVARQPEFKYCAVALEPCSNPADVDQLDDLHEPTAWWQRLTGRPTNATTRRQPTAEGLPQ